MTLALRYAAMSHVGLLRTGNEDSVYAGPRLLAVADGMGGHAAGEVASAVAIASIAALDEDAPGADLLAALQDAAETANRHLRDMVAGDSGLEGMGTTLTSILFTGNRLGLLHIGDSRCYLLRDGELSQITHDDTLVQSLVDEGRITAEQASSHPQRNMILRALDGRPDVAFDLSVREARDGDRYLLCSDGLTGPVTDATLRDTLDEPDPQVAAERLVELALRGGGPDNITVIVADVVDGESTGLPVVAGAAAESPQELPQRLMSGAAGRAAERAASDRASAERTAAERAASERAPAGRAAAAPAPAGAQAPAGPPAARGRHVRRTLLLTVVAVGLLAGGAAAGTAYVRSQWFVGADGEQVSVFRGLTGSIAGLSLSSVERRTDLATTELSELDRGAVQRGIRVTDRADAQRIVDTLQERTVCRAVAAEPVLLPDPRCAVPPGTAEPGLSPVPTPSVPSAAAR